MATCKLNAEQFSHFISDFAGVMLVYRSTNRDGVTSETAQHFWGEDYEVSNIFSDPKEMENEVFRVWKNVVATFWSVKQKEMELRQDNDGIRSKLRASTPAEIIIHTSNRIRVRRYELEESVWSKIGLVPTKKDLERTARDFKKAIHAATKASFDALGFRVDLQQLASPAQPKVTAEVVVEPIVEPIIEPTVEPVVDVAEVVVEPIAETPEVVSEVEPTEVAETAEVIELPKELSEDIAKTIETAPVPQRRRGRPAKNNKTAYAA